MRDRDTVAVAEIPAAGIEDGRWTRLPLDPALELPPGSYRLPVEWRKAETGARLSLWMQGADGARDRVWIDGCRQPCALELQLDRLPADAGAGFRIRRPEPVVRLLENPLMDESGAYFLAGLDSPWRPDFSAVGYVGGSDTSVQVTYKGEADGWVVLPVRAYPGWRAYVDGRAVEYRRFAGLMPAVPVEGPSEVELRYRPVSLYLASAASLLAWLLLGYLFRRLGSGRTT
jgi:hypothetical protein